MSNGTAAAGANPKSKTSDTQLGHARVQLVRYRDLRRHVQVSIQADAGIDKDALTEEQSREYDALTKMYTELISEKMRELERARNVAYHKRRRTPTRRRFGNFAGTRIRTRTKRKRCQFMFYGKLRQVRFWYTGKSVQAILDKGVNLVSLKEAIDTNTSTGKLLFTLMPAIAQFERDVIADRTKEGLRSARARGRVGGRPKVSAEMVKKAMKLYRTRQYAVREIEELTGVKKFVPNPLVAYYNKEDDERCAQAVWEDYLADRGKRKRRKSKR